MRIVMPLFDFERKGETRFAFANCPMAVELFDQDEIPQIPLFSEQDLRHMSQERWALVYDAHRTENSAALVNLLLIAFRILSEYHPPFIKYRLCKANPRLCTRLAQPMMYNYAVERPYEPFDDSHLEEIDAGFQHLRKMDSVSPRTHNALYFLYRAFHTDKWIDSFLLMMSSLEALFSNDAAGGATKAIKRRVSSLLNNAPKCTEEAIGKLYALRSKMTHGSIVIDEDPGKNLKHLAHLEFVAIRCFRQILKPEAYASYETKRKRNQFMAKLDGRP